MLVADLLGEREPVVYVGATPVFVDVDADTWTIDPELLDRTLGERPQVRALVAVDLYGQCCDYDALTEICERRGVALVQDAAESLGASYRGAPAGGQGALAAFSFNGNKVITTSGGGMLVSRDEQLIAHARKLSTQAREPAPHYQHTELGFNYRLSNLLAAVGRAQLEVLGERVEARRRINARYRELLAEAPGISFMPEAPYGRSNCWLTCILVDPDEAGTDRETIRLALEAEDIEARPLWKPMHLQPFFAGRADGRRRRVGVALRARPLPAERLGADRRPIRRGSSRYCSASRTGTKSSQSA